MTIAAMDRVAATHLSVPSGRPPTTRSSELLEVLEILRTTAAEGAASRGCAQSAARASGLDIANVAATLALFEAKINAIAEQARQRIETIHQQALTDVRRIDGEAPTRVENAGPRTLDQHHSHPESEQRTIMQRATADADRIQHRADTKISDIVDTARALVWAAVTPETEPRVA